MYRWLRVGKSQQDYVVWPCVSCSQSVGILESRLQAATGKGQITFVMLEFQLVNNLLFKIFIKNQYVSILLEPCLEKIFIWIME